MGKNLYDGHIIRTMGLPRLSGVKGYKTYEDWYRNGPGSEDFKAKAFKASLAAETFPFTYISAGEGDDQEMVTIHGPFKHDPEVEELPDDAIEELDDDWIPPWEREDTPEQTNLWPWLNFLFEPRLGSVKIGDPPDIKINPYQDTIDRANAGEDFIDDDYVNGGPDVEPRQDDLIRNEYLSRISVAQEKPMRDIFFVLDRIYMNTDIAMSTLMYIRTWIEIGVICGILIMAGNFIYDIIY